MGRVSFAILLPLAVFPLVAAAAIFIGWTMHQFTKEGAVVVAFLLTVGITVAGFVADRAADQAS